MGTASSGKLGAWYNLGKQDYYLGGHLLWQVFRSCLQMRSKPYVLGGVALLAGFIWGVVTRANRPIGRDLIAFHQREQMQRLRDMFRKLFTRITMLPSK